MRQIGFAVPFTVLVLLLSACSSDKYFTNRNVGYADATLAAPLTLPDNRDASDYRDIMPVPAVTGDFIKPSNGFVVPTPLFLKADVSGEGVSLQQTNGQQWLLIETTPEALWPLLEAYLKSEKLSIIQSQPKEGTITTSELTFALRRSTTGATELYCLHQNQANQACVAKLQHFLSAQLHQDVPLNDTQQSEKLSKIQLVPEKGQWHLNVKNSPDVVWTQLKDDLVAQWQDENQKVLKIDNAHHEMWIRYKAQSNKKSGFFSMLSAPQTANYEINVLATAKSFTTIEVKDPQNKPISEAVSREILTVLAGYVA